MTNEKSVSMPRTPIPDRDIPRLQVREKRFGVRMPLQSRYEYVRHPEKPKPDRRFDAEITDAEAEHAKAVCGNFLSQILLDSQRTGQSIPDSKFYSIYWFATSFYGLSRLEAEELASYSKDWLTYCLDERTSAPPITSPEDPHHKG